MTFLGIDLHSNNFICCFLFSDNKKKELHSFSLNPDSLKVFYKLLSDDTYVMLEASTNTFKFVDLIKDRVREVFVANTHKLKLISMVKRKTDRIDSEKLALYLKMQVTSGESLVKPVYVPEQTIRDLRSLFSTYKLLRKNIGSLKNRIHSLLKQNLFPFTKQFIFGKGMREAIFNLPMDDILKYQLTLLYDQLDHFEEAVEELKKKVLLTTAPFHNQIDILTSMKGISVFTAAALIADIATVKRFPNSKNFTSYLRSAPGVDSSNGETRVLHTTKFGRKLSVTLLSQSLNHFRDRNPKLNRWYNRVSSYKPKGKIRMALCRRVLTEIYQMLKKQEYHYFRDIENHKRKMIEYYNLLHQHGITIENRYYKKTA